MNHDELAELLADPAWRRPLWSPLKPGDFIYGADGTTIIGIALEEMQPGGTVRIQVHGVTNISEVSEPIELPVFNGGGSKWVAGPTTIELETEIGEKIVLSEEQRQEYLKNRGRKQK